MSRYEHESDFYQGQRDFERRGHRDYNRDRYASSYTPDGDYMDGYKQAEREEERRQEEIEEQKAEERRQEQAREERRRQEYWEQQRIAEEEQRQEEENEGQFGVGG
jgi:hypothetical protein